MSSTLAPLLVLNGPATSLQPSLLAPLARLIATVADRSQVMVVTHANALAATLGAADLCTRYELKKELGDTIIEDAAVPRWGWPKRH